MSLIRCRDCAREMSTDAISCLGCGGPNRDFVGQPGGERTWNRWCLGLLIVFLAVPVLLVFNPGATEVGGRPARVRSAVVAADPPPASQSPAETHVGPTEAAASRSAESATDESARAEAGRDSTAEGPTSADVVSIRTAPGEPRTDRRATIAVTLKQGRRLVAQEVVERGDDVVVKLRDGVTMTFPRSSIASIERPGGEPE